MLRDLLALFPIDAADADRAAFHIATPPTGRALAWAATLATGVTVIAVAVLIGGAA